MVDREEELGTGRTGGRDATTGVIPGRIALSVGCPDLTPPPGWSWTSLSSVAQLESGHTPSRRHPEYWDGGIPWIGIKDATENHGRTLTDTYQHVSALGLENSSARLLPANTVCLSRTASVGFVVVMGRPMATSQDFVNWVCGPNIEAHYLKYVLLAENEALWRFASGTTHQTIYYPEAKAFHVCLPPLAEQKAIAGVLGALDDKIELNRRMNATLEAIARALFQSWFVDFDPVRAKLDGRQPLGMDEATAALFPATFQASGDGHIPKGWSIKPVGEVVDCVGGGTPSTAEPKYWAGGMHHWTTPKDFSSLQAPILLDTDRKLTAAGIAKISSGLLPAGTLLLSSRAPVGYLAIAAMPVAINQGFIALKCNERASNFFMLNWCQTNMAEIESRATGTTFAEISKQNFRPIRVVLPSMELMAAFTAKVEPIYAQITANLRQSHTLATLRDTLLTKLLSGAIAFHSTPKSIAT
jgi:type I restriction enzyme S subunit